MKCLLLCLSEHFCVLTLSGAVNWCDYIKFAGLSYYGEFIIDIYPLLAFIWLFFYCNYDGRACFADVPTPNVVLLYENNSFISCSYNLVIPVVIQCNRE